MRSRRFRTSAIPRWIFPSSRFGCAETCTVTHRKMGSQSRRAVVRVRRSPHLVVYWRNKTLVACNYATGARAEVPPRACELLSFCDEWTRLEEVQQAGFVPAASFACGHLAVVDAHVARAVRPAGRPASRGHGNTAAMESSVRLFSRHNERCSVCRQGGDRPARSIAVRHHHLRRPSSDTGTPQSSISDRRTARSPSHNCCGRGVLGAAFRLSRSRLMSWPSCLGSRPEFNSGSSEAN